MKTESIYYVARAFKSEIFNPQIVETFNDETDANSYAALMCRTKKARYVVLKQCTDWDGTNLES